MKVHIIGCSGAGKTYFAQRLAQRQRIPHFDLDDIQWDREKGCGAKLPVERRDSLLAEMLAQPDWVIEGIYYRWVGPSFRDADVIYVLDLPLPLCRWRIVRRFFRRRRGLEPGYRETVGSVWRLLVWTGGFHRQYLPEIQQLLEPYREKTVWIHSRQELNRRLAELT